MHLDKHRTVCYLTRRNTEILLLTSSIKKTLNSVTTFTEISMNYLDYNVVVFVGKVLDLCDLEWGKNSCTLLTISASRVIKMMVVRFQFISKWQVNAFFISIKRYVVKL